MLPRPGSSAGIYIEGEGFRRVENAEHFAEILEEKLGRDAADKFREFLEEASTPDCTLCSKRG